MVSAPTLTTTTSEFYERYVAKIREIKNPYIAMARATSLLRTIGYDWERGTNVPPPSGTEELVARIDQEISRRIEALRAKHLGGVADMIQARLQEFRSKAISAGYHLTHQN